MTSSNPAAGREDLIQAPTAPTSRAIDAGSPNAAGSMTIDSIEFTMPPCRACSGWRVVPPVSAPPSSSHMIASPDPLCAPNDLSAPSCRSTSGSGSVVGGPPRR
jgi:hypothetical protein